VHDDVPMYDHAVAHDPFVDDDMTMHDMVNVTHDNHLFGGEAWRCSDAEKHGGGE
jgi:hypothetical protein